MTIPKDQQQLISDLELQQQHERVVEIHLSRLKAWTKLPDERTDWDLEIVLDELAAAAKALRQIRTDAGLPF